jgi:cleavage and polyadenylation specificity factor subunit 2
MNSKVPLQGAELEAFLQKERAAKEKEFAQQAMLVRNQRMLEADEDESDSDSEEDSDDENEVQETLAGDMTEATTDFDGQEPIQSAIGRRKQKGDKGGDRVDWAMDGDEGFTKQLLSYDIYLKGNVSKGTSFFKNVGGQTQRFRMFPYVEKKRRVDDYGETIDIGMWLRKGKALEEDSEGDAVREFKRRKQVEDDAKVIIWFWIMARSYPLFLFQNTIQEPPSKFVSSVIDVQMACRLLFVDMEGLNDGRAVKTIVPQVNPRKMVRIEHSPDAPKLSNCFR